MALACVRENGKEEQGVVLFYDVLAIPLINGFVHCQLDLRLETSAEEGWYLFFHTKCVFMCKHLHVNQCYVS